MFDSLDTCKFTFDSLKETCAKELSAPARCWNCGPSCGVGGQRSFCEGLSKNFGRTRLGQTIKRYFWIMFIRKKYPLIVKSSVVKSSASSIFWTRSSASQSPPNRHLEYDIRTCQWRHMRIQWGLVWPRESQASRDQRQTCPSLWVQALQQGQLTAPAGTKARRLLPPWWKVPCPHLILNTAPSSPFLLCLDTNPRNLVYSFSSPIPPHLT